MMDAEENTQAGGKVRVGISGWTYPEWRGGFYPKGLAQAKELAYAAGCFSSIEINGTFYGLKRPESFRRWRDEAPDDFVFAVKAPKYITHTLRLKGCETPLANFLASGPLALGAKLGPFLWQFPKSMRFEHGTFADFLALLPKTADEAVLLARRHDAHVEGHVWLEAEGVERVRHAVEVRHESFHDPRFTDLLRAHGIALVVSDAPGWAMMTETTADFVYCRLHGAEELYVSGYDEAALDRWAGKVRLWSAENGTKPRDVFVYFDNTYRKMRAPQDALGLASRFFPEISCRLTAQGDLFLSQSASNIRSVEYAA